jgi:hypothetical protein
MFDANSDLVRMGRYAHLIRERPQEVEAAQSGGTR